MKIGSELTAKVISQVNAVLQRIKKILTGAYLDLKLIVLASLKGLRRLVRKSAKALKESRLFPSHDLGPLYFSV